MLTVTSETSMADAATTQRKTFFALAADAIYEAIVRHALKTICGSEPCV